MIALRTAERLQGVVLKAPKYSQVKQVVSETAEKAKSEASLEAERKVEELEVASGSPR